MLNYYMDKECNRIEKMKKTLLVIFVLFLTSLLVSSEEIKSSNVEYPEYQPLKPKVILYDGNNLGGVRTRNNETNFKGGAYREETNGVQIEDTNYVEKFQTYQLNLAGRCHLFPSKYICRNNALQARYEHFPAERKSYRYCGR